MTSSSKSGYSARPLCIRKVSMDGYDPSRIRIAAHCRCGTLSTWSTNGKSFLPSHDSIQEGRTRSFDQSHQKGVTGPRDALKPGSTHSTSSGLSYA